MATRSFLVQIDDDDMEYHAQFDAQRFAEAFLEAVKREAKKQKLCVLDIEVKYLGEN
jgi:hypothetical protein